MTRIHIGYPVNSGQRVLKRVQEYLSNPPPDDAKRMIGPLLGVDNLLFDDTRRLPYAEAQKTLSPAYPKGRRYYRRSLFVDHLSDELLEVLAAYPQNRISPQSILDVWTMEGKVQSVRLFFLSGSFPGSLFHGCGRGKLEAGAPGCGSYPTGKRRL